MSATPSAPMEDRPVQTLLVEIGCEEIPARFLAAAQGAFADSLTQALRTQRLDFNLAASPVRTFSTPRRLGAFVPKVLLRSSDLIETIEGPPVSAAYDKDGKATRAAEGFARKHSVSASDLLRVPTARGEYVAVNRVVPGSPALKLLPAALRFAIGAIEFPKSMKWNSSGARFARPIRWILALLGEGEDAQTVPFEVAGVPSANRTHGHRLAGPEPIVIESFADYAQKLRRHFVEFDPESRRQSVRSEVNVVLEVWQEAVADPELEEWVVNSTEWVAGLRGEFDPRFLKLPREILVTVMRDHQKYFAVEDREGKLQPNFVTMLNRDRDASGVIRAGHERVLTARFRDAEFFWNADQKVPLAQRLADGWLERVTYQAKLGDQGSYASKIARMKGFAEYTCGKLEVQGRTSHVQRQNVLRAVELCKCDLTTQMVQEFTELQGVVGGLYAREQGESQEVADAIYDHYKPVNFDDNCPRSLVGAVVSLADKLDAVTSGFKVGLGPTGSGDPFGLRRAGNGIVKLYVEALPGLGLDEGETSGGELKEFFRERLDFYLQNVGLRYDTARAVLSDQSSIGWQVPSDVVARGRALEEVRDSADFQALSAAAKRTRNILTKSAKPEDFGSLTEVNLALFKAPEERDLYGAYEAARADLARFEAGSDHAEAFHRLSQLRPAVDLFFDKVMVMDSDLAVRANRLRLLAELDSLAFRRFADLSEIGSESTGSGEARAG